VSNKEEAVKANIQGLTFTLGEEIFAVDISSVKEVLEYKGVTKVPRMPDFMIGVINLRDHAVPVLDMRIKFGMECGEVTVDTCVVIVETEVDGEAMGIGILVDSVNEVASFNAEDIESAPKIGTQLNTDFIQGMVKTGERFTILLKIDSVLNKKDLEIIAENQ